MTSAADDRTAPTAIATIDRAADRYLELLKRCLSGQMHSDEYQTMAALAISPNPALRLVTRARTLMLRMTGLDVVRRVPVDAARRLEGRDWPEAAETMIGIPRLDNLQVCIADVIRAGVPGDLIETGVWRGGATIFMRAVLEVLDPGGDRNVWVADSFQGLPKPDARSFAADANDPHWRLDNLAISMDQVKANFSRYGLLDSRVRFLPGWFRDTLPSAPIDRLSVLRLDGDMYESTIIALSSLYPKLSVGGYVIIDDYALAGCRSAVEDFRAEQGITDQIEKIDWTGVYWRRSG